MNSFQLLTSRCHGCDHFQCVVVKCPRCQAVRWLEDWEVRDDFAVCPEGCIVDGYETMPSENKIMCREVVYAAAIAETEAAKLKAKPRNKRKPRKEPTLF